VYIVFFKPGLTWSLGLHQARVYEMKIR